jgi:chromate reductase
VADAKDVAVLIGSLRKDSWARKVANALCGLAPPRLSCTVVEIGDLPLYNPDLDVDTPAAWTAFRDRMRKAQAVLFSTPEYNRSVPSVLKNAIDVGSRPSRQGAINGKPCAIVSVSPGKLGGFGANHHLRQSLVFLDMPAMLQPEAYVSGVDKLFDADGTLASDDTRKYFESIMGAFARWIDLFADRAA